MEFKSQKIDGHEVYYSADWIKNLEAEIHFRWYYHQAKMVYVLSERSEAILEVGVGTGLLSDMLKKRGWNIKTLDIDEGKHPDFCANALDFDYRAHRIDTVLAFEIFEHIPFLTFEKVIENLRLSGIGKIYFSLPWNERKAFSIKVKFPKLREKMWTLWWPKNQVTTYAHFWEISHKDKSVGDKKLISLETLYDVFGKYDYKLTLNNRVGSIQYFSAYKQET